MSHAWGIAGWVQDTTSSSSTGSATTVTDYGSQTDDGNNLCRVTLIRNRDPGLPLDQSAQQGAQGQRLLCLIADGVRFPAPGDRVMVAIPEDAHGMMPGGSLVIATVTSNPVATGNLGDGDQVIFASPVTGARIVHRGDGALVFATTLNGQAGGPMTTLVLGGAAQGGLPQTTFKFQSSYGQLTFDSAGSHWSDAFGNAILMGGIGMPAPFNSFGNYVTIETAVFTGDAPAVNLGSSLLGAYLPAVWGPSPAGSPLPVLMAGITSMQVKIGV
jgi:hypothetical protein